MTLKVYNLRCSRQHSFEGWFASAEDFESQRTGERIGCPVCHCTQVVRAPSAPYIGAPAAQPAVESTPTAMPTPAQMQAILLKVAREIAASTENVGERFAEEARRIHYREAPERGIRGVASGEQARALADEGIAVMPLPFAHLIKESLQ
jgi:hypothetical protein